MQRLISIIISCCLFIEASAQPNIVRVEYFVDIDPGFGNATSVPITPGPNIIDNLFNIGTGPLAFGFHTLFIRSKDANGKWSVSMPKPFYKTGLNSGTVNITKAEYFIDTDPGFGNAIDIPLTSASDIPNINIAPAIGSLSTGFHYLFVRSKNANGIWSVTNNTPFFKPNALSINIVKAEYFIDTDPGFGNAMNIPITAGLDVPNLNIAGSIGSLSTGFHYLYVRSKNANGIWSVTNNTPFYKPNPGPVNIVNAEYFIDTDPGFGNATSIPITAGVNIPNYIVSISTTTLTNGLHFLSMRSKDANGIWSVTNIFAFIKLNRDPVNNITDMEYFIDNTDPGFGKAVPLALIPANVFDNFVAPVNISGLSVGSHKLFFRSRTNNGWSVTNLTTFPIATTAPTPYINVNAITKTLMCAGDNVKVSYDAIGPFNAGNVFNIELSDGTGTFAATPPIIGSYTGVISTIVNCVLPTHLPDGNNYRVRASSTNPVVTGLTGNDAIVIHDRPYAQTVTGASDANAGYSYPYSLPLVAGSTWQWVVPAATISQTANTANLFWNIVGQPQPINVYETNQYGCIGDASTKNVNVYPLKITNTAPSTFTPCNGDAITVSANAYGVYYAGNMFTAQLSDATGSFASPVSIGTYNPGTQPLGNAQPITINAIVQGTAVSGTNYRIRIISSNYAVTSDTSAAITIVKPSPSFTINNAIQCHGGNNFIFTNTSSIVSGSITSYQWNFGDNTTSNIVSPTHVFMAAGTYPVKLVATSNLGCMDSLTTSVTVNNCGTYTFTGNGDWLTPANWLNNLVPPTTIPNNMNVTINPSTGGQCFYIGMITLQTGGVITVISGKAFNIRLQ